MKYIRFEEVWIDKKKRQNGFFSFLRLFSEKTVEVDPISNVEYWLLEINDQGKVCREIGIDSMDRILQLAPATGNRGQWIDSNVLIDPQRYENISLNVFEDRWRYGRESMLLKSKA